MVLAHKRLSIAAAAMMMALAAGLVLYVSLFSSSTPAYALEQTAEANRYITSYHVKITPPSSAKGLGEAWVQLAPDGAPLRGRVDLFGGDHGDRVGIVSRSRGEFWWKAGNHRVVCGNNWLVKEIFDECSKMRALFDPKLAFEQLQADEEAGKVQVATQRPAKAGEPIVLTVTSKGDPNRRLMYEVDSRTKLVQRIVEYRGCGDQWQRVLELAYLDYNREIDPKVFQPDLPKGVVTIDLSKMDLSRIGVAQRNLTDDQIIEKLAREFFETLVDGGYQRLAQLNDVRSARWKTTTVVKGPGRESQTSTGTEMFLMPFHERVEKTTAGKTKIELVDGQKDFSISLTPAAKTALVLRFKNRPSAGSLGNTFPSLRKRIAEARGGTEGPVERLGIKTIDGRLAQGFRIRHDKSGSGCYSEVTIWADPRNSLPVRVEEVSLIGREETRTVMTDFQVNVDLDESLFRLDVPTTYTVQTMQVDFSRQPIDHFVDALKLAAEHNGDVFPTTLLGGQGLMDILRRALTAREKKFGKDSPEMLTLGRDLALKTEAMVVFLSALSPENEWHYAGQGVKLYTPDKPIFWYKPTRADRYRVVLADLKIKELALESFQHPFGPVAKPLGDGQFEVAFTYRPSRKVQSVYLAGSFNQWKPTSHRMDGPDHEGRFSTRVTLKKGTHLYKFVLDGQTGVTDPNNIWLDGSYQNSEAQVGILFQRAARPLGHGRFEVAFSYRPSEKVKSVYLAGSFNDWRPTAKKMDGPDHDGRFSTRLELPEGTYEYKFVLDGRTWQPDPDNPWRTGFYQNSLLHVGGRP